jgi:hypothetical protein
MADIGNSNGGFFAEATCGTVSESAAARARRAAVPLTRLKAMAAHTVATPR